MYKVFFNQNLLTFCKQPRKDVENFLFQDKNQFDEVAQLLSSECSININIFSNDVEIVWAEFLGYYKLVQAAGGIVRNYNNDFLFIYRLGKWDLPKGKIEDGETKEETAVREIEEECSMTGLFLKDYLMPTYHIYFQGEYIIKETFWFDIFYNGSEKPIPQIEEGIECVEWKRKEELPELLENSYPNIKLLMEYYLKNSYSK